MFHPQDVPNYFTGSFRLAADEPRDNPLFYLIHTPDGQPTLAIEQPEENHIFEGTGLTSNYSIRADVNSTSGPDVNQVTFLIHKNNDLPLSTGEKSTGMRGATWWLFRRSSSADHSTPRWTVQPMRSEEHTSELQSPTN